jgi:hypothetical protein
LHDRSIRQPTRSNAYCKGIEVMAVSIDAKRYSSRHFGVARISRDCLRCSDRLKEPNHLRSIDANRLFLLPEERT